MKGCVGMALVNGVNSSMYGGMTSSLPLNKLLDGFPYRANNYTDIFSGGLTVSQ
jgi:hypothetical protein